MVALSKEKTCFEGCRSSSNGFPGRRSAGRTVDRRAFGQNNLTYELLILNRHTVCSLVGKILVTMRLYVLDIAALKDLEVLTRHPTKCARTTKLEAYVKVAPVSGSTYFL